MDLTLKEIFEKYSSKIIVNINDDERSISILDYIDSKKEIYKISDIDNILNMEYSQKF